MDINTLRGLSSVLVLIAFVGICWWAFSPKRRKRFDEAANLPFADEPPTTDRHRAADSAAQETAQRDSATGTPTSTASDSTGIASAQDAEQADKKQG